MALDIIPIWNVYAADDGIAGNGVSQERDVTTLAQVMMTNYQISGDEDHPIHQWVQGELGGRWFDMPYTAMCTAEGTGISPLDLIFTTARKSISTQSDDDHQTAAFYDHLPFDRLRVYYASAGTTTSKRYRTVGVGK